MLQFWTSQGHKIKAIEKSRAEYRNIAWSKDGERLATVSDRLRIWSKNGKLLRESHSPDRLWGLAWGPGGQQLVTSGHSGEIAIWNDKAKHIDKKLLVRSSK